MRRTGDVGSDTVENDGLAEATGVDVAAVPKAAGGYKKKRSRKLIL